jgi:dihydrofolate reductase
MGRKTFESIGKPLPQRINIVISRSLSEIEGVNVFSEVEDGITFANQYNEEHHLEDEVIIIGGAQIFNETLPIMNRLVLTQVDCEIAGDVFYPEIDMHNFSKKNVSKHLKDEKNQFNFSIDLYEKI